MDVNFKNTPFPGTSYVGSDVSVLNMRCKVLLGENVQAIQNKHILDLGSHDGRMSFACLQLGAKHVTGIEGRQNNVDAANQNLIKCGCNKENFRFIKGDAIDGVKTFKPGEIDTVLCLNFFYHTSRQLELIRNLRALSPKYLIIETYIDTSINQLVEQLKKTKLGRLALFFDQFSGNKRFTNITDQLVQNRSFLSFRTESTVKDGRTIEDGGWVARPSMSFLFEMFRYLKYDFRQLNWITKDLDRSSAFSKKYINGTRVAFICERS